MNFWCLKAGGFLKQELSTERWILRWIFWSQNAKEKSAKKIRRKIRRLESKNPPGVNPPLRSPHRAPPPNTPPPLGRATPSPEPSGLGLAAPVCLCRWLVRRHLCLWRFASCCTTSLWRAAFVPRGRCSTRSECSSRRDWPWLLRDACIVNFWC